jgi:acyl-CoA thioesterase YciA
MPNQIKPRGELSIRTLAMPADTNPGGEIFGGWVVSQMDLAGLSIAREFTDSKVVTIGIQSMKFIAPIHVGDFVCCYTDLIKVGNTSLTINIETWAIGRGEAQNHKVTEGIFTYVAVDQSGKSVPINSVRKK